MALTGWLAARHLMHGFKLATVTVAVSVIAVQPASPGAPETAAPHAPAATRSASLPDTSEHGPVPARSTVAAPAAGVPDPARVVAGLPVKLPPLPTVRGPKLPPVPKLP